MKRFLMLVVLGLVLILPQRGMTEEVADYLILNDIGQYKLEGVALFKDDPFTPYRKLSSAGILGATGHWVLDHDHKTYETAYTGGTGYPAPTVTLTHHCPTSTCTTPLTSPNGLTWLLHEVEDGYRDRDDSDGRLGRLSGAGVKIREIDGNKIIYWGLGGGSYSWISSGNKVSEIKYVDLQRTKPEPIEVIKAYLAKHPSLITLTDTELKSTAHNEQWIKDEMDRRLWLCDKWIMQLQLGKAEMDKVLRETVAHMNVFLDYREKYYGMKAATEKQTLSEYQQANNGTAIKNKLTEYKAWWAANKNKAISL